VSGNKPKRAGGLKKEVWENLFPQNSTLRAVTSAPRIERKTIKKRLVGENSGGGGNHKKGDQVQKAGEFGGKGPAGVRSGGREKVRGVCSTILLYTVEGKKIFSNLH